MVEKLYRVTPDMYYAYEEPEIEEFEVLKENDTYYVMSTDDVLTAARKDMVNYAVTDAKKVFYDSKNDVLRRTGAVYFYKKSYARDYLRAVRRYHNLWQLEAQLDFKKKTIKCYDESIKKLKSKMDSLQDELDKKLAAKLESA